MGGKFWLCRYPPYIIFLLALSHMDSLFFFFFFFWCIMVYDVLIKKQSFVIRKFAGKALYSLHDLSFLFNVGYIIGHGIKHSVILFLTQFLFFCKLLTSFSVNIWQWYEIKSP